MITKVDRVTAGSACASDPHPSAEFIAVILGLEVGAPFGPFLPVDLGNGVTLDYFEKRDEPIQRSTTHSSSPTSGSTRLYARP